MSDHPVIMPKLGQAMEFGAIAEWLVADGAVVRAGQPMASVESDKATFEIEATETGVLHHLAKVGDEIPVGEPFATIGEAAAGGDAAEAPTGGAYALPKEQPATTAAAPAMSAAPGPATFSADRPMASPKARAVAQSLGVDLVRVAPHRADGLIVAVDVEGHAAAARPLASPKARAVAQSLNVDLAQVAPHRADRLIVAADVEAAATAARKAPASQPTTAAAAAPAAAGEGVPLTRLQRVAADRLARSWAQAPHIVQMVDVDAEQLVQATAALRESRSGTLNDLLIKAAADCVANFPGLNARFAGDRLIPFGDVGIGLAVATDAGLTVPVVRGADRLSLGEVSARTRELIGAARDGKLGGAQLGGASLTISNLGAFGVSFGTPVLNLDEPILVFVGAVEERPVVRDGQLAVGRRTTLSIAYDHRVVDGLAAARFSQALKSRLETIGDLVPTAAADPGPVLGEREIQATSAPDGLAVRVRSAHHGWVVDEPESVGGHDAGPDPVNLVLGGLASCMVIAFKLAARRRKIPLGEVRAHVSANPAGKVKEASVRLEVWSSAPEEDVRKLLAPAKTTCFVHDMLRPDLPIALELTVHTKG